MRITILGGNGFIGTNLCRCLSEKEYDITSFDLVMPKKKYPNINYISGNFFDDTVLENIVAKSDVVFHAVSTVNPTSSCQHYMDGYNKDFIQSIKLAEFCLKYKTKMIYLSSGGTVYGKQDKFPIPESAKTVPINHYGNIKLCIENTFSVFNYLSGANIIIARIANPYGPGQDYKKGVGFIDAVLKGAINKEIIKIYGTGAVTRDYIYIDDVCYMLEKLMFYRGKEYIFNLGTGIGTSQNEIIDIVKALIPDLRVEYCESRSIDVPQIFLDNTVIRKIYDRELTSLKDGLYEYYIFLTNDIFNNNIISANV